MIDSSYEIKRQKKKKKNLGPHSSVVRRHVARSIEPKASVRRVGGAFAGQARGKYGLIAWIWITELCTRRPSPLSRAQGTDTRGELPQRGRQKKGALKYLSKFHPCTFCAEAATAIEKRERDQTRGSALEMCLEMVSTVHLALHTAAIIARHLTETPFFFPPVLTVTA